MKAISHSKNLARFELGQRFLTSLLDTDPETQITINQRINV